MNLLLSQEKWRKENMNNLCFYMRNQNLLQKHPKDFSLGFIAQIGLYNQPLLEERMENRVFSFSTLYSGQKKG